MTRSLISRIDHVSIAVKDYDKAQAFFRRLLGGIPGAGAEDPSMKYFWQLFSLGDLSRLELIRPTGAGSFLDNFLSDREGGVHHITLQTPSIREARRILEEQGIPYFGYNEYMGSYWKELFIHPRHAFGVLLQIAEFTPGDWLNDATRPADGRRWSVKKFEDGAVLELAHPGGGTVRMELNREEIGDLIADLEQCR